MTLVRDGAAVTSWRVPLAGRPASRFLDELARLRLAATRHGCEVRVDAPCALGCVLDAAGLSVSSQPVGEAEGLEELRVPEVQEVVVTDDPVA